MNKKAWASRSSITAAALAAVLFFSFGTGIRAEEEKFYLEQNYTKAEYRIPMRDGVKLYTAVYSPKDTSIKYPILMRRTPYSNGPYGKNQFVANRTKPWRHLAEEKFIFVFQDVRGTFMSEGEFSNMTPYIPNKKNKKDVDEPSDTYDTVDWLIKNVPNNNGNLGVWGISYPGFYAAMSTIDAHPAIKAVSPQAPISDWFVGDDFHHNGAFSLLPAFRFLSVFGIPRKGLRAQWPQGFHMPLPDAYKFFLEMGSLKNAKARYLHYEIPFWDDVMKHGSYDEFWQKRSSLAHFKKIKPAVLTVGGWFDAENAYGAVNTYKSIEKNSPGADNRLVMGPWFHGGWVRSDGYNLGEVKFTAKTGEYYVNNIELPFFNYYLKGKGDMKLPEASVFETGSNTWKQYHQWPPKNAVPTHLYFTADRGLSFQAPLRKAVHGYISDPNKPVPFVKETVADMPKSYMVEDQRFAGRRPDVLVYESDTLEESVTLAGPVTVDIYVSTSGTDSDWIVKLIDTFPDTLENTDEVPLGGYQMLLRGDIMRGKFRNSMEKPEAMVPGQVTRMKFTMVDVGHTFRKGHKITVQVQSSWFPVYDRNPQTFVDIYNAQDSDFKATEQKVYIAPEYPSSLVLTVVPVQ